MTTFYYLIGPPASGKTTLGRWLREHYRVSSGCPDDYRAQFPNESDRQAFRRALLDVHRKLRVGWPAVFDATNTLRCWRRDTLAVAHGLPVQTIGLWLDTPLDVCLTRHEERRRRGQKVTIPNDKIIEMYQRLISDPPSLDEGFATLIRLTPDTPFTVIPPPLRD